MPLRRDLVSLETALVETLAAHAPEGAALPGPDRQQLVAPGFEDSRRPAWEEHPNLPQARAVIRLLIREHVL